MTVEPQNSYRFMTLRPPPGGRVAPRAGDVLDVTGPLPVAGDPHADLWLVRTHPEVVDVEQRRGIGGTGGQVQVEPHRPCDLESAGVVRGRHRPGRRLRGAVLPDLGA